MSEDAAENKAGPAPVVATIELTQQDLLGGIVEMSGLYRIRGPLLAMIVVLNLLAWRMGALLTKDALLPQLLTFGAFGVFAYLSPWLSARRQLQAMTAAGDANVTYRFDDEGVTIRSAGATSNTAYRRFVGVKRGKTTLLLYTTPQVASIVPLRAFSAAELVRVLALLPAPAKPQTLRSGRRLVIIWASCVLAFLALWQVLSMTAKPTEPPAKSVPPSGI